MFKEIDSKMNLPKTEEEVLKFWDENKIFQKSLEIRKDCPNYSFYDGPPFATGTPHYGHIIGSTIKDVVPRYWTMKGYYIERKWGWDCHGLPIENIAEKELGITRKNEIEKIGVEKFNETCRSKVLEYVEEWEKVIHRLGRWADMENSYKTMDMPYMESVWWVFKELWEKELIYEGYRSMHICPRCETTLSQSEVSEGYKMVRDIGAIVKFKLENEFDTYILAWTTTPWTLLANVALAVNPDVEYVKIKHLDEEKKQSYLILAKDRLSVIPGKYKTIEKIKGKDLVGKKYEPLFDYFYKTDLENKENGWKIYPAPFVTTEEGTGIVHIAPAFGEDDLRLGQKENLPFIQHIGMDGVIIAGAENFSGLQVKPKDDSQKTDVEVIKYLAKKDLLFSKEKYEHSYPHCWRCETPLLNYATSSWFVNVLKLKEEAMHLAKPIRWIPKHIKAGRFGKWLEGARDWSISRQRYWASVIPIWRCDKCNELLVFGSIKELEEISGQKITDLHKHIVDKVTFGCPECDGTMKRVPDVLDTWFDSGSMPYGQFHYPFDNQEKFQKNFPADFIAEGIDQTRTWFYYLHLISTVVMKSPAFENVIVNGIVLAADGKKMSKRLQNYPDPMEIFEKYGADVTRFYLLSSPVVVAENLNFNENDLADIGRGIFRMLWNSYSFFVLYANIDRWEPAKYQISNIKYQKDCNNLLDRWILSELNLLVENVNKSMENYELNSATRLFPEFIDNLSNWYIRRSRKRFWKSENDQDKNNAYETLFSVLTELAKLMAPFTPFISEEIYKNLTGKESVHLENYPTADINLIDKNLNEDMKQVRKIVEAGLSERAKEKIKVRQPLESLEYRGQKVNSELEEIIAEEVNVKKVVWSNEENAEKGIIKVLDTVISEELKLEGRAREIIRNIQSLRKKSDFKVDDRIEVLFQTDSDELKDAIEKLGTLIAKEVLANSIKNERIEAEGQEEFNIDGKNIRIGVNRS